MPRFLLRARFAVIVAAGLGLLVSGVAVGAAGSALIIGSETNNAGVANTQLITNSNVIAFKLLQNGPGTALMGYATAATGGTRGVYGRVDSPNGDGIQARNAGAGGTGSAVRAFGGNNIGLLVDSSGNNAIEATSTSGAGIFATGAGFTGAVLADGTGALAGVIGEENPTFAFAGVWGLGNATGGNGVYGSTSTGVGVRGNGPDSSVIDFDCSDACWDFPGGAFASHIGVIGQTDSVGPQGESRGVMGVAIDTGVYGVVSVGDARIDGSLSISGTCTGCVIATIAVNGSAQTIHQGDAVTLIGVTTAADGTIAMTVAPAKKGDAVLGIADRTLTLGAAKVTIPAHSRKVPVIGKGMVDQAVPARTVTAKDRKWSDGGTATASKGYLRIITSGMFAFKPSASLGVAAGDSLAVGATTGKVSKAGADAARGTVAGTFIGTLSDGRVVIMVGAR